MTVRPDLEALKVLLSKATPGTWRVGRQNGAPRDHLVDMGDPPAAPYFRMHHGIPESSVMRGSPAFGIVESDDAPAEEIAANAALIVAMRNALPDLIAHIERLQSDLRAIDRIVEDNITETDGPHRARWKGEWIEGPAAEMIHSLLRGMQKIARATLSQGTSHE